MKKIIILFSVLIISSKLALAVNLTSMTKEHIQQVFINKTFTSIPTDNLNGKTIDNTFSMFLDNKGNMWGKMAHKPKGEPQKDIGIYSIDHDGTVYFTWQHWDGAQKLCAHVFETQNSYITIDCSGVFHTVFMKSAVHLGNKNI